MDVALVYADEFEDYRFPPGHPMRPERYSFAVDLARAWHLPAEERAPDAATIDDLLLAHDRGLVAAVRAAADDPALADPRYGLGPGDTPGFPGMHEAASLIVGGTLLATRLVLLGEAHRALNPAGGLHHAHRDRAAGFCVYNDCVVAIERATRENPGLRVAYVDIDAHHGDGVQEAFYDRADVLTLSVHESGSYLYPGTGHNREIGEDAGRGFALNVPMPPFAGDACYALVLAGVIAPALRAYSPDLVFLQGGADTHRDDPLAHLDLTVTGYARLANGIVALADELCGGRLVMTGGGGYEAYSAVPRMWAAALALLLGMDVPDTVPGRWLERVREHVPDAPGETLGERGAPPAVDAQATARELTGRTIDALRSAHPLLAG